MKRSLVAWFNGRPVGELTEQNNLWCFAYSGEWLAADEGFDLSPALPRQSGPLCDGGSDRPVQWFFDNLLPEEGLRTLLAADAKVDQADAFGLLSYFGAESAGALVLLPPGRHPEAGSLQPLPREALSGRIGALPKVPLTRHSPKRMSPVSYTHLTLPTN